MMGSQWRSDWQSSESRLGEEKARQRRSENDSDSSGTRGTWKGEVLSKGASTWGV